MNFKISSNSITSGKSPFLDFQRLQENMRIVLESRYLSAEKARQALQETKNILKNSEQKIGDDSEARKFLDNSILSLQTKIQELKNVPQSAERKELGSLLETKPTIKEKLKKGEGFEFEPAISTPEKATGFVATTEVVPQGEFGRFDSYFTITPLTQTPEPYVPNLQDKLKDPVRAKYFNDLYQTALNDYYASHKKLFTDLLEEEITIDETTMLEKLYAKMPKDSALAKLYVAKILLNEPAVRTALQKNPLYKPSDLGAKLKAEEQGGIPIYGTGESYKPTEEPIYGFIPTAEEKRLKQSSPEESQQ